MYHVIYGAYRGKATGTEARDALDGEKTVSGHMILRLHTGSGVEGLLNIVGLADMACRAVADLYNVLALSFMEKFS